MRGITQYLIAFLREKKGVVAIEVGLTIGAYLMVIFMIFEMGRIAISHAYLDLVITEAVRITKNTDLRGQDESTRVTLLKEEISRNYERYVEKSVMGVFAHTPPLGLKIDVKYADTPEQLVNNIVSQAPYPPLARYLISYHYNFAIPLPFISQSLDTLFRRQFFVVVQK